MAKLTDILLRVEGADPTNEAASIAWVSVHRPAAVYVGGTAAELPRYRIFASVPEGQFDTERRQGMVAAVAHQPKLPPEYPGRLAAGAESVASAR